MVYGAMIEDLVLRLSGITMTSKTVATFDDAMVSRIRTERGELSLEKNKVEVRPGKNPGSWSRILMSDSRMTKKKLYTSECVLQDETEAYIWEAIVSSGKAVLSTNSCKSEHDHGQVYPVI